MTERSSESFRSWYLFSKKRSKIKDREEIKLLKSLNTSFHLDVNVVIISKWPM